MSSLKILNTFGNWIKQLSGHFSIRSKLTFTYSVVFGISTLTFAYFALNTISDTLQSEFDDALYNYTLDISDSIKITLGGDLTVLDPELNRDKIYPFSLGTALVQIRNKDGKVLLRYGDFGSFNPPFHRELLQMHDGNNLTYRTVTNITSIPAAEASNYRVITLAIDQTPGGSNSEISPNYYLQVAAPMTLVEAEIRGWKKIVIFGIPSLIFVATLVGWLLSSRALSPVNEIINRAELVGAQDLSVRVPVPFAQDEVRRLAETLNDMLSRIEKAFLSQERFVADASHQLLTPITILKNQIEILESQTKNNKVIELHQLSTLKEDTDNLTKIVRDMLLLAKVDAGQSGLNFQNLYLDEIVTDVLAKVEKLASTKNIKLKLNLETNEEGSHPQISGDHDLLYALIFNLIENAIKYSPREKPVDIKIFWNSEITQLSVRDYGPGIPDPQKDLIFQRFSRGAKAEVQVKGYGLGLAIAQKIALLHRAELDVMSHSEMNSENGAQFIFKIKNI